MSDTNGVLMAPGQRIKAQRLALRLSTREFAKLAGISASAVSGAENDRRRIGPRLADKLSAVLGIPAKELMTPRKANADVPVEPESEWRDRCFVEVPARVLRMARMVAASWGVHESVYLVAAVEKAVKADLLAECKQFVE